MKKERNIWWLILSVSGISSLAWLTNTHNPEGYFLIIFFGLIFVIAFSLGFFILGDIRRSMLSSAGIVIFFWLRLLGLREFFYPLLLIASLLSLEVYLKKR